MDSHDEHHEELGFWRKYVFSVDHKVIGIQYTITGLLFLLFGFTLMMIMRWQLAYPGQPIPLIGELARPGSSAPGGIMLPEFYNQLGAMHGTIMVFLGVVPLAVGGFGNFVMPLQIGAPDMAFPKLNMVSYWVYFVGGVIDARELLPAGRRRAVRLDLVSAARGHRADGQTIWLIGMVFLITSSLLGSVNFIVTIVQLRAKGLTLDAAAVLRLGAVRHVVPAAARVPAARSGRRAAVDGPPRRHQLLPAERPGRHAASRC